MLLFSLKQNGIASKTVERREQNTIDVDTILPE